MLLTIGLAAAIGATGGIRPDPIFQRVLVASNPYARRLDNRLAELVSRGFSGTVLVARDGHIILYKGYGLADREHAVPATAVTRYPLGAVANTFVATAMMTLEGQGVVAMDDQIGKYLADASAADASIEQLLRRDLEPVRVADAGGIVPAGFSRAGDEPTIEPVERFASVGGSYPLLERLVEERSGMRYQEFVWRYYFDRGRMTRTGWVTPETPDVARGYGWPGTPPIAATGIVAPLSDMYIWTLHLRGDGLLSDAQKLRMYSAGANGYGYGIVVGRTAWGSPVIQHAGDAPGFQAWYARYPKDHDTVILLAVNTSAGWRSAAAAEIEKVLFGKKAEKGARKAMAAR
ncbi:MAG: serine hydrolase domain-containing protein [Gemmatimonadota bacterium]